MRSQLTKKRTGQLVDILADVVAVEGPIHRDALCRGVAAAHQARYTGHVKTKLVDALAAGAAAGRYILREPFVWPAGMERPPVRWRGGDEAAADADLICIEEVAEAAALVVRQEFGIPLDDLPASTIRALGFKRIGPQLLELGRAGVERAVAARLIVADNSGFMVAANRD